MRASERGGGDLPAKDGSDALPDWRRHDLRRTMRSKLPEVGVATVVAEMMIGHKEEGSAP